MPTEGTIMRRKEKMSRVRIQKGRKQHIPVAIKIMAFEYGWNG